eukprot:TRINITY_DN10890_c0_g1_i2.p1 TRINITY_DN10890_c0_g1~~TRINITY_DN10890_c0_g1_i2.p1  ORF type:complete len:645 (+),score=114.91 TRINITY_DN10890_c0_g1_i2:75-1937(+)
MDSWKMTVPLDGPPRAVFLALLVMSVAAGGSNLIFVAKSNCWGWVIGLLIVVFLAAEAAWVFFRKRLLRGLIPFTFLLMLAALMLVDMHEAGRGRRLISVAVLYIFAAVYINVLHEDTMHTRVMVSYVAALVVYVVLFAFEQHTRFGMTEAFGAYDEETHHDMCSCESPPCRLRNAGGGAWHALTVIATIVVSCVVAMRLARSYQRSVRMERFVIVAAEEVARSLSLYDLEAAKKSLDLCRDDLPPALSDIYDTLIKNLAQYRPYVPQACLPGAPDSTGLRPPSSHVSLKTPEGQHSMVPDQDPLISPSTTPNEDWSAGDLHSDPSETGSLVSIHSGTATRLKRTTSGMHFTRQNIALVSFCFDSHVPCDSERFAGLHQEMMQAILKAVTECRGVIDGLDGHRVMASFNAVRPAPSYSVKAITSVALLGHGLRRGARCRGALAAGPSYHGVLGTSDFKRPVIIGPALEDLRLLEHYYTRLQGSSWVSNEKMHSDTSHTQPMRIVMDKFYTSSQGPPLLVYEVVDLFRSLPGAGGDDAAAEWLYELDQSPAKKWELYNEAGKKFIKLSTAAAFNHLDLLDAPASIRHTFQGAIAASRVLRCVPQEPQDLLDDMSDVALVSI